MNKALLVIGLLAILAGLAAGAKAETLYRIVDLGALDGYPSSSAAAVNNEGLIVGRSNTVSSITFHDTSHAFAYQNGTMTDMGVAAPGDESSVATAVNDSGLIAGGSTAPGANQLACVWQNGVATELGTLLYGNVSYASGINDLGQVVGTSNGLTANRVISSGPTAFVWQNGNMTALPCLSQEFPWADAYDINNSGQVVGESATPLWDHPVLWQNGLIMDLGLLSGTQTGRAVAINDRGQIAGVCSSVYSWSDRLGAFIWQDGIMRDIGPFIPTSINNRGDVVGRGRDNNKAVLWQAGVLTYLETLGGGYSYATCINDYGQIVGYSTGSDGQYHAVLWQPVPEPSSILALLGGFSGLLALKRRQ